MRSTLTSEPPSRAPVGLYGWNHRARSSIYELMRRSIQPRSGLVSSRVAAPPVECTLDVNETPFGTLFARYFSPFWMFKDASRGDRLARAAAYRHNRSLRGYLPLYAWRWMVSCALLLAWTNLCDACARQLGEASFATLFTWLAAGGGIAFTAGVCMTALLGYLYLYLGKPDS